MAGTGYPASAGDHGPAVDAQLNDPVGLALGSDGTIYVADRAAHRVRAIAPDGIIATVAGTGVAGPSGDGGPATDAGLGDPIAVAVAPNGDLYIADSDGIRRVSGGVITTFVAGGRQAQGGFEIDGRPVNLTPSAVAVGTDGHVYVADFSPKALAEFDADGTVLRVWKGLYVGWAGLAPDPGGGVLVADYGNFAVDQVRGGELMVVTRFSRGSVPGLAGTFRPSAVGTGPDGSISALDDGRSGGSIGALLRITSTGAVEVLEQ